MDQDVLLEVKHDADDTEADGNAYLNQLLAESKQLDPSLIQCHKLLNQEIARVKSGKSKFIELHRDSRAKVSVDVRVPVKEFPEFNFVGKILGPKGNSLKRLQEETQTRIAVLGQGSVRDKRKEEDLRKEGGKYVHLNEQLHVHIEALAHPEEAYYRLSHALHELSKYLVPDHFDEVSMSQIHELAYLDGKASSPVVRGSEAGYAGRGGRGGFSLAGRPPISSETPRNHSGGNSNAYTGPITYGRGYPKPAAAMPSQHHHSSGGDAYGYFMNPGQRPKKHF